MLSSSAVRALADDTVFVPGQAAGHYESHFIRANHPKEARAFWIRYTVFQPEGRPKDAVGELWAIYFDGKGAHTAARQELPFYRCSFDRERLGVRVGDALLSSGGASGKVAFAGATLSWRLSLSQGQSPLLLLPTTRYAGSFPKAKSLVSAPLTHFDGELAVNGKAIKISDWVGSRNHNWGRRHTDEYAWGQVAGFHRAPDVFLELATARIRIGPFWTPYLTPIALRVKDREYSLNAILSSMRRARFGYFYWDFHARDARVRIRGRIEARKEDFVCLPYYNPPGGVKYCLNTKIASCRLQADLTGGERHVFETENRAAFEILTDDTAGHGLVPAFPVPTLLPAAT